LLKSQSYEATLRYLEASLKELSRQNTEKGQRILKLTRANAKKTTWLFILGGVTALAIVFAAVKIVIAVKTGGAKALLKSVIAGK
jgi:hypothetical protein